MLDLQFAASADGTPLAAPEDLDRLVESISRAGFAAVELPAGLIADPDGVSRVRVLCYRHQIAPLSACYTLPGRVEGGAVPPPAAACIEALDRLGAEYLIVRMEPEASVEASSGCPPINALRAIAVACAGIGLKAAYRPAPIDLYGDSEPVRRVLSEIPGDLLGLALDLTPPPSSTPARCPAGLSLDLLRSRGDRSTYLTLPLPPALEPMLSTMALLLEELDFSGWVVVDASPAGPADERAWASARMALRRAFGS